jgi:hypothetical protein
MGLIILTAPFGLQLIHCPRPSSSRGIGFHYERMTKHGAGEVTRGPNNDPPAFLMGQKNSHMHAPGP